jgi:tRNA pseudouridine38-40 synthase
MRYFLEISYKGTSYKGWQIQDSVSTVQGTIQSWLSQLLNCTIEISGSSRTDSGVHASQQYAHFDFIEEIDTQRFVYKINSVLPRDISIKNIFKVEDSVHARYSAISRTYEYIVISCKDPFLSDTSFFFTKKLDIVLMNKAAAFLCDKKLNCKVFSKINTNISNHICNIVSARWITINNGSIFKITSNRFLRGMVRIIVAYCIEVGLERLSINEFEEILNGRIHVKRPSLVPACGLKLINVLYQ